MLPPYQGQPRFCWRVISELQLAGQPFQFSILIGLILFLQIYGRVPWPQCLWKLLTSIGKEIVQLTGWPPMLRIIRVALYGDSISLWELHEILYPYANGCIYMRIMSYPSPQKRAQSLEQCERYFCDYLKNGVEHSGWGRTQFISYICLGVFVLHHTDFLSIYLFY